MTSAEEQLQRDSPVASMDRCIEHRMSDRWTRLKAGVLIAPEAHAICSLTWRLVDNHMHNRCDLQHNDAAHTRKLQRQTDPMEDGMRRWIQLQQHKRATQSSTEAARTATVSTVWASLLAMPLLNIWDVNVAEPVALLGLLFTISVVCAAQQHERTPRGLQTVERVLAQFFVVLSMALVAYAGTVSLAAAAWIVMHSIGWASLGDTIAGALWSPRTALAILALDAAFEQAFKVKLIQSCASTSLKHTIILLSWPAGLCGAWSDEVVSHTHAFIRHAPLELQCHWLAMLQPLILLSWLKRLWYCIAEGKRKVILTSTLTTMMCAVILAVASLAIGGLWYTLNVQGSILSSHARKLTALAITVSMAALLHQDSPDGLLDEQLEQLTDTETPLNRGRTAHGSPINTVCRDNFHAATIRAFLPETGKWIDILADLGAATSLMKASTLGKAATQSWRLTKQFSKLIAANGMPIGSVLGRAPVRLQFAEDGPTVEHMASVVDGGHVPDLLGVDFFSKYEAEISFATKSMSLQINGQVVEVPFSVDGRAFDSKLVSNVQQDCAATATARARIILLPGFAMDIRADVKRQSHKLHRSQTFIAESTISAHIKKAPDDEGQVESELKKLMRVMRAIPRALVFAKMGDRRRLPISSAQTRESGH